MTKINEPHPPEFTSVKQLYRRMTENERSKQISVADSEVPPWQRQIVWTDDDQGLLALSIVQNYPIGLMVLWRKGSGVRVPIDGRQRLNAIRRFMDGEVAIPLNLSSVPEEYRGRKYTLSGVEEGSYRQLSVEDRDRFDDYQLRITQYDDIPENEAMDIFVRLQGGKSLSKTEIRAALGGKVCDFITEQTSGSEISEEEIEEEAVEPSKHPFFRELGIRNSRKAHRNVCDILLHEYLYPGQDKHWSSLEALYRDKANTLTDQEKSGFRDVLSKFRRASLHPKDGKLTSLYKSAFLILTYFRAWRELTSIYAVPSEFRFSDIITDFEGKRSLHADELPWVNFNAALSNAGYAKNRTETRHEILTQFIHRRLPGLVARDHRRSFTTEQKIAIWYRARQRCEWVEAENRCEETFADFRDADADHFVRWVDGGKTTVENGRLLCIQHNR